MFLQACSSPAPVYARALPRMEASVHRPVPSCPPDKLKRMERAGDRRQDSEGLEFVLCPTCAEISGKCFQKRHSMYALLPNAYNLQGQKKGVTSEGQGLLRVSLQPRGTQESLFTNHHLPGSAPF